MSTAIARTEAGTWPREILVMARKVGYFRIHLPPLLYAPALAVRLERALLKLRGVRRVNVDRQRARISVFYDPWVTDDRPALLEIDRQGSPLISRMEPDAFGTALIEQTRERRAEQLERGARVVYLGLLSWVHVWVFRAAIRNPLRLWWFWALLGFGLWMHRRQIRATNLFPG